MEILAVDSQQPEEASALAAKLCLNACRSFKKKMGRLPLTMDIAAIMDLYVDAISSKTYLSRDQVRGAIDKAMVGRWKEFLTDKNK